MLGFKSKITSVHYIQILESFLADPLRFNFPGFILALMKIHINQKPFFMRKIILFVMILSGLLQTASAQETKKEEKFNGRIQFI